MIRAYLSSMQESAALFMIFEILCFAVLRRAELKTLISTEKKDDMAVS